MSPAVLERHYVSLGAAFTHAALEGALPEAMTTDADVFLEGLARGLPLSRFKRLDERLLGRVRPVIARLAELSPESLLDVGSGRGTTLWPLLDAFPSVEVTAVDADEERAADLATLASRGIPRLSAQRMDATDLAFPPAAFDGVLLLQVLDHVTDAGKAVREAVRVARRFVIASVSAAPKSTFDETSLARLFAATEAETVSFERTASHLLGIAIVRQPRAPDVTPEA